jgi:hypothetical protein
MRGIRHARGFRRARRSFAVAAQALDRRAREIVGVATLFRRVPRPRPPGRRWRGDDRRCGAGALQAAPAFAQWSAGGDFSRG